MKKITILALSLISANIMAANIDKTESKKKSADPRVSVSAYTRDLKAPYGQPVKASGTHVLVFKNILNTNMIYEYYYSLKINNQHTDQNGVITLKPYEEKRIEVESAIYNILFNRGSYRITACTATIESGSACDKATLTVY